MVVKTRFGGERVEVEEFEEEVDHKPEGIRLPELVEEEEVVEEDVVEEEVEKDGVSCVMNNL